MIIDKYIRYYYNVNGRFDSNMRFYKEIEERAKENNLSTDAYLFSRLGYNNSGEVPADVNAKIRALAAQRHFTELYDLFETDSRVELNNILDNIGARPDYISKVNKLNEQLDKIALAVANYLRNVTDYKNSQGVTLAQQINMITYLRNEETIQTFVEKAEFKDLIKNSMPNFAVRKDVEPYITGRVCFVPYKLNAKDKSYINATIRKHLIRPMYLNKTEMNFVEKYSPTIDELFENNVNAYLKLLDIAIAQDITIQQLLSNIGMKLNNIEQQLAENNFLYYLYDTENVRVYTNKSRKPSDNITLGLVDFKYLYEKDYLRLVEWEDGKPYIVIGEKVKLEDILGDTTCENRVFVDKLRDKQMRQMTAFGGLI